jgi:histone H3/H4
MFQNEALVLYAQMASLYIADGVKLAAKSMEDHMADVLVVTSKVKKFIKETGGCNTSAETVDVLSKAVERLCQKGFDSAKADGRKTVMARDIVIDHI